MPRAKRKNNPEQMFLEGAAVVKNALRKRKRDGGNEFQIRYERSPVGDFTMYDLERNWLCLTNDLLDGFELHLGRSLGGLPRGIFQDRKPRSNLPLKRHPELRHVWYADFSSFARPRVCPTCGQEVAA